MAPALDADARCGSVMVSSAKLAAGPFGGAHRDRLVSPRFDHGVGEAFANELMPIPSHLGQEHAFSTGLKADHARRTM